jgi:hypothetical protein
MTVTSSASADPAEVGPADVAERALPIGPTEPGWSLWGDAEP